MGSVYINTFKDRNFKISVNKIRIQYSSYKIVLRAIFLFVIALSNVSFLLGLKFILDLLWEFGDLYDLYCYLP